jgi:quercetin dioxygenase-like cupin family protein
MTDDRLRAAPSDRYDAPALAFDLHAEAAAIRAEPAPVRHGHRQKTIYKHGGRTMAVFVMEDGAALPEHATAGSVTIQALEGRIVVTAAGAEHRLDPGHIVALHPGVRHDVRAVGQSVFLLQVSLNDEAAADRAR